MTPALANWPTTAGLGTVRRQSPAHPAATAPTAVASASTAATTVATAVWSQAPAQQPPELSEACACVLGCLHCLSPLLMCVRYLLVCFHGPPARSIVPPTKPKFNIELLRFFRAATT